VERRLAAFVLLFGALLPLDANVAAGQKQTKYVQVVKRAPTSVSLGYSTASVDAGQPVQFTARVAPAHPSIPTGSVVFVATGTQPGNMVTSPPTLPAPPFGSAAIRQRTHTLFSLITAAI